MWMNTPSPSGASRPLRWLLLIVYAAIFAYIVSSFFSLRGGLAFLEGADLKTANRLLFPLAGLIAYFLVWGQVMIGSNLDWVRKHLPGIETFHRRQGVFALLFALLHPTLLLWGVGFEVFMRGDFVDPALSLFVWFGRVALLLIVLTAGTALLRRTRWFRRLWRRLHYLNYVIFILVSIHSLNLGTDVRSSLKILWGLFILSFLVSALARIWRAVRFRTRPVSPTTQPTGPGSVPPPGSGG